MGMAFVHLLQRGRAMRRVVLIVLLLAFASSQTASAQLKTDRVYDVDGTTQSVKEPTSPPAAKPGAGTVAPSASLPSSPGSPGGLVSGNGTLDVPSLGWGSYMKAVGGLFGVLALVFLGFWAIRKLAPRLGLAIVGVPAAGAKTLQLEASLPLGQNKRVVVVRFLNKRMVLGVADAGITCLHIQEDDHAPPSPHAASDTAATAATAAGGGDVLKDFASRLKDHL